MKVSINSRRGSLPMSKRQSKLSKTNAVKPRKVLLLFATLLILVAMIVGGFYIKFQLDVANAQAEMKEYLQNKYRQEFVVEKPEHKGGGLAVEGHFDAIAYPKDDSTLKFVVNKSSSGILDRYADKVWSTEETRRVRQRLDEIMLENDYKYHIEIGSYLVRADIRYPLPDLDSFINKHNKSVLYTLEVDSSGDKKETNYSKVLSLIRLLREKNSDSRLIYRWSDGDSKHIISVGRVDGDRILDGSIELKDIDRVIR